MTRLLGKFNRIIFQGPRFFRVQQFLLPNQRSAAVETLGRRTNQLSVGLALREWRKNRTPNLPKHSNALQLMNNYSRHQFTRALFFFREIRDYLEEKMFWIHQTFLQLPILSCGHLSAVGFCPEKHEISPLSLFLMDTCQIRMM